MSEQNIAIAVRWFEEFWGKGNGSIVDELASEEIFLSYPLMGEHRGKAALKKKLKEFHSAFSDNVFKPISEVILGRDSIVVRWEACAVYTGEFGGLPRSLGQKIRYTGISIVRLINDKIIEEIGEEDRLMIAQQINSAANVPR